MANKIMDVARPGATLADANSKPVIITHRPMVADPMVNTRPAALSPARPLAQAGKKIEPLSTELKAESAPSSTAKTLSEPVALLEAPDAPPAATPAIPVEPTATTPPVVQSSEPPVVAEPKPAPAAEQPMQQQETEPAPPTSESKAKSDKQAVAAEQAKAAHQAELRALVDSKKYYLKIDDSATSSIRTFVLTVLVVLLIGAIGLVVAIDAGVLDLGVDLPFNLIK